MAHKAGFRFAAIKEHMSNFLVNSEKELKIIDDLGICFNHRVQTSCALA